MDLSPGEKAVLGQIRVLYSTAAGPDQQIKALTAQWAPTHHEAYENAYEGLVAKSNGVRVSKSASAGTRHG